MNLLKKLTRIKKEQKKENYYDFYLNSQITNIKNHIKELSSLRRRNQKNLREEKVQLILKELKQITYLYESFIKDLKKFEMMKQKQCLNETAEIEEKISFMQEKKKSLRRDFEDIYMNFKRTAIGLEDIPIKTVLKKMHTAFDFDGKKYYYDNNKISNF